MSTEAKQKAVTASQLEDYLMGDLPAEEIARIEAAARDDESLANHISERRADIAAFMMDGRRRAFSSLVEEADTRSGWFSIKSFGLGLGFAVAVAAAVMLVPRGSVPGGVQTKGGLSLEAAVLDGGEPRLFDSSRDLHPGDRLRLTVDDPGGGFVTVILEESSGEIEVLYRPDELGELKPGTHRLPGSLELDGSIGQERIYVIMSNERPDPKQWQEEIQRSHERSGFQHGWLPQRGSRVQTLEYKKVAPK